MKDKSDRQDSISRKNKDKSKRLEKAGLRIPKKQPYKRKKDRIDPYDYHDDGEY